MIAGGEQQIAEVFIMTKGAKPGTPCGGCRQRLAEFADASVLVHCGLETGEVNTYTMGELLPHAFDLPDT
jgi:cytidine deaminase